MVLIVPWEHFIARYQCPSRMRVPSSGRSKENLKIANSGVFWRRDVWAIRVFAQHKLIKKKKLKPCIGGLHVLHCHRGFLRPQWQICGRTICPFPQFTANFIIFHETTLVFTIFEQKSMVFRGDKVPKVGIVHFFHFHTIVLNLPVCFKLLYWKLPSRCLTLKSSFVYFQFHLRDD